MMDQPKDKRSGAAVTETNQARASVDATRQNNGNGNGKSTGENRGNSGQARGGENQGTAPSGSSMWQKVKGSFSNAAGQIVFGMEDGTVSIFGLVFGMAFTANSSHAVLLAGATGAAAAAVSMMAGAYLDVQSTKARAQAQIAHEKHEIETKPQEEEREIRGRLQGAGFNKQETDQMLKALKGKPDAMLKFESAFELQIGTSAEENPVAQAIWMFLADLIAASIPVIPFAFLPLGPARWASIGMTGTLLLVLGLARAFIAKTNVIWTILETMIIAVLAGAAGVGIGLLLNSLS